MAPNSEAFDLEHPLLADRHRLERILDVMYAKIQKTLFPGNPGRRRRAAASPSNNADEIEEVLVGTAVSADDVLWEALSALLQYPAERLEGTWEGLAVRIARNKAVSALRTAETGLRGTRHREQLHLVSGDLRREGPDGKIEPSIFETLPSDWGDPEAEFFILQGVLKLRDLARAALGDETERFSLRFISMMTVAKRSVSDLA